MLLFQTCRTKHQWRLIIQDSHFIKPATIFAVVVVAIAQIEIFRQPYFHGMSNTQMGIGTGSDK
jgi:hypothetical protein